MPGHATGCVARQLGPSEASKRPQCQVPSAISSFCPCPALQEVLDGAQVLCCTLTGALHPQLQGQVVDVVVIDEAAQALEAACWSALLKGRRAVLAGGLWFGPCVSSF